MDLMKALSDAGVPASVWSDAEDSINEGKHFASRWIVWWYNLSAPIVMLLVLPFVRWDAESVTDLQHWLLKILPHAWVEALRGYDNNISLNGDRADTYQDSRGDVLRRPESLDPNDKLAIARSYVNGKHPRSFRARYTFIGIRNRGKFMVLLSTVDPQADFDYKADKLVWGPTPTSGGYTSEGFWVEPVLGWQAQCMDDYWQLRNCRKLGTFLGYVIYQERNYGWKVNNVNTLFAAGEDPLVAVNIAFKFRFRRK